MQQLMGRTEVAANLFILRWLWQAVMGWLGWAGLTCALCFVCSTWVQCVFDKVQCVSDRSHERGSKPQPSAVQACLPTVHPAAQTPPTSPAPHPPLSLCSISPLMTAYFLLSVLQIFPPIRQYFTALRQAATCSKAAKLCAKGWQTRLDRRLR